MIALNNDVTRSIKYINRFLPAVKGNSPGWIVVRQETLCRLYDQIVQANDGKFPVYVHFHRHENVFRVYRTDNTIKEIPNVYHR